MRVSRNAGGGVDFDPDPFTGPNEKKEVVPMSDRLIPLTDHRGNLLVPPSETHEPLPGSILMTDGEHGTAWQRFFSDGRWHPTRGGDSKNWDELMSRRNVLLVYDAEPRADRKRAV